MITLFDQETVIKRYLKETFEEGREEGREEGWQEGREEGREEGQMENAVETAKSMLLEAFPADITFPDFPSLRSTRWGRK